VVTERSIVLEHNLHGLLVHDRFEGAGEHCISIPWHLSRSVEVEHLHERALHVKAEGRAFVLAWDAPATWKLQVGQGWVSPSYGVKHPIIRLEFVRTGLLSPLSVILIPEENLCGNIDDCIRSIVGRAGLA
jgi:hypothetical protein